MLVGLQGKAKDGQQATDEGGGCIGSHVPTSSIAFGRTRCRSRSRAAATASGRRATATATRCTCLGSTVGGLVTACVVASCNALELGGRVGSRGVDASVEPVIALQAWNGLLIL